MTSDRIRRLGALLGAALLCAALAPQARADAPAQLTYQGRLKESGAPVTGPREVDLLLCSTPGPDTDASCTIDTVGQPVTVTNGLFRTTFTVPGGLPTVGQWWLQVRVGPNGTSLNNNTFDLSPREQMTSSPYAVYATSATTLIANAGSAGVVISTSLFVVGGAGAGLQVYGSTFVVNSAGNVGIGTAAPAALLSIYAPQANAGPDIIKVVGNGIAGQYFNLSGTGRIMINPDINGGGSPYIGFGDGFNPGGPPGGDFVSINPSGSSTSNLLHVQIGNTSRMIVTASGNVGIGTTNPALILSLGNTTDRTVGLESPTLGSGNN